MKKHYIPENLYMYEYLCPFAEDINPHLLELLLKEDVEVNSPLHIKAKSTGWELDRRHEAVNHLVRWVHDSLMEIEKLPLVCPEVWGVVYNEGDSTECHSHFPSVMSFTYYVNAPEGSSPLVFPGSGTEVEAQAGKVVVFESRLRHEVPPNKCDGRCVIAGNFISPRAIATYGHPLT